MSDGFLARWTRRKRAVRAAEQAGRAADAAPDAAAVPEADGGADRGALDAPDAVARSGPAGGGTAVSALPGMEPESAAGDPAETADPLPELPDLATLTRESDLTPFLRAGVPAALRNAALRRMWSIDPAIRDFVSEAREYAYDWNSPGGVPGLGPLLPSDDVQAMLRRIMGGPAPEAAAPEAGESPAAAEAMDPDTAILPAAEPATQEPGQAALTAAAPPVPEPAPARAPAESASAGPAARPVPDPAAAPGPRLRRHGGAMPA